MTLHDSTVPVERSPLGVVVLIPAFNEAERIAHCVKAALGVPGVGRVVVIDDGSKDDTAQIAEAAGAWPVIRLPANRGKGAALTAGWRQTTEPVLLLLDADLGSTAGDAGKLLEPVLRGEADMTIGCLPRSGVGGGFGLAVRMARWGIHRFSSQEFSTPLSGQRCVTRELLTACGGFGHGFGVETALTIDALRAGFRVKEVETNMAHRVTGKDFRSMLHRLRQLRDITRVVVQRYFSRPVEGP